jgi:hypothetical protein
MAGYAEMPSGPKLSVPTGETMPVDGGPGSTPTPAPGAVPSPGSDDYTDKPGPSVENIPAQIRAQMGRQQFGQLPTSQ